MTLRSIPLIPTVIVAAAIVTMIALGFWQLNRMDEKEQLLASYMNVPETAEQIDYPQDDTAMELALYQPVRANCIEVLEMRGTAGTNRVGVKGWSQIARCSLESGGEADIAIGWSRSPDPVSWAGGAVTGILGPGGRIVADPPLADLGPLAKPDPADLPNNHLAYAGQWFLFALTALIIYIIALRRRAVKS